MLVYRVTGDVAQLQRHLSSLAREKVPIATAIALTKTSKFIQRKLIEEMARVFDRPTRFTLNALRVTPATTTRLFSSVHIKNEASKAGDAANRWLMPQIEGGTRKLKRLEQLLIAAGKMPPGSFLVPAAGIALDAHGNVSRGQLSKVTADLRANFDTLNNATARSTNRRRRVGRGRPVFYFSTYPKSPRTAHLPPGIYKRTEYRALTASMHGPRAQRIGGSGTSETTVTPAFIFVRSVRYRKRLRFYEMANMIGPMRWKIEFPLAMRHALATHNPSKGGFRLAA